jgi:hypothetical protein
MNKFYFVIIFTFLLRPAFSQKLYQITIDNRGNADAITFLVDETVIVNITKEGKIIEWGTEYSTARTGIYPILQKYMGREEYYPETDNEAYRGKIKYIGRTQFTYYTASDNPAFAGKIKTIGTNFFDYYTSYDDVAFRGYIKNAGQVTFTYYSSFNDESYKGKIKSVGSTALSYYGSIDDKAFKGKIKNIDRSFITYYSSYERKEYAGMIKSGSQVWNIGGIKYFIKLY